MCVELLTVILIFISVNSIVLSSVSFLILVRCLFSALICFFLLSLLFLPPAYFAFIFPVLFLDSWCRGLDYWFYIFPIFLNGFSILSTNLILSLHCFSCVPHILIHIILIFIHCNVFLITLRLRFWPIDYLVICILVSSVWKFSHYLLLISNLIPLKLEKTLSVI